MAFENFRVSNALKWLGIALIIITGLIHAVEAPEYFEAATYLGILFVANAVGALLSAYGIFRNAHWGWLLGLLVAGGALVMYLVSRTVGLPGLDEKDWGFTGILSLVIEALFIIDYGLAATNRSTASVE